MENKRAWKNRIMAFVMVAVVMVSVFSTTLVTHAAESVTIIQDAFEEPYVGDNAGYVNVLVEDKGGDRYVFTYSWNITVLSSIDNNASTSKEYITSFDSAMNIEVVTEYDQIKFMPFVSVPWNNTGLNTAIVTLNRFTGGGTGNTMTSRQFTCDGDDVIFHALPSATVIGIQVKGNYGTLKTDITTVDGTNSWGQPFNVIWADDNTFLKVFKDVSSNVELIFNNVRLNTSYLANIKDTVSSEFNTLNKFVSNISDDVSNMLSKITSHFPNVESVLDNINRRLGYLVNSPDTEETEEFEQSNNEQADKLNGLNEQSKVEKVEPGNVANDVGGYIDGNAVANYGTVLAIFTNNNYVLDCLLVVFAMALVSYVLFGKKG